jgi:ribose-phosphate pyrophosphokinase
LRFPNREIYLKILENVRGKKCLVIGSSMPPEENLFYTLLLIHTLKKEGAKKVKVLIPYLAYSRHEQNESGKSWETKWLGEALQISGAKKLITFDLHTFKDKKVFSIPIVSIRTVPIVTEIIKRIKSTNLTLVAADRGALLLVKRINKNLKIKLSVAYFHKTRTAEGVALEGFHGHVGEEVMIIDDMLDTGETLYKDLLKLKEWGVKKVNIFITHGLFTGSLWKKLFSASTGGRSSSGGKGGIVQNIYCTDTVPLRPEVKKDKRIKVISILPILNKHFIH